MILVDHQIVDAVEKGILTISPFVEANLNPNSYDITLDNKFITYRPAGLGNSPFIDPYDGNTIKQCIKEEVTDCIAIKQGDFVLAQTVEYFDFSPMIAAELMGKSSLARLGLTIHQTGGFVDSGFRGTLTLEIGNINPRPILLHSKMPIGQLVFHKLEEMPRYPYGDKITSKYQGQGQPTLSKYYYNDKR